MTLVIKKTIIVVDFNEDGPVFGQIDNIYIVDTHVFFEFIPIFILGFNSHYFAYSVSLSQSERLIINYNELPTKIVCLYFNINDDDHFVATRHVI